MEVHVNTGSAFTVPATVADHLLKLATHAQLKVLLYILCHANEDLSAEEIVRACSVTQSEVEEAIVFWQNVNVLTNAPQQTVITHVQTASTAKPAAQAAEASPAVPPQEQAEPPAAAPRIKAAPAQTSSSFSLLPSEIAERKNSDSATAQMLIYAEHCAGRLLNHTEMKSLIWMHEYLGLEPDLIIMLAAYCMETQQFQVRTMEAIAVQWQEDGILTHALAQEDIQKRTERRSYTGKLMTIFGMTQRPTAKQQGYFDSWQQLHMSPEMVQLAYDQMRDHTNGAKPFPYTDKVLKNWAASGILTPQQAAEESERFYAAKQQQQSVRKSSGTAGVGVGKKPASGRQLSQSSIDIAEVEKLIHQI